MSAFPVQHNKFQKPKKQIKILTLQRKNAKENWGFSLTGGWDQGQWIGKRKTTRGQPSKIEFYF